MEISRSRIVKGCLFALFARIGTFAGYRSNGAPVTDPALWVDPAFAAPRGEAAAQEDLHDGLRKVALFGLITKPEPTASMLRGFSYELQAGGCLIGGSQYDYSRAANSMMIRTGRNQCGKRFVTVLQNSLT
jgi:hypothetical protein